MMTLKSLKKTIQNDLDSVNQIIHLTLNETGSSYLADIYTHILQSQGKQIRATLILLLSNQKNERKNFHRLAAGIELIHLASLIHDDIIDDADLRRNLATIHKKFNLNNGIISGVHCYAMALKLIASIGDIRIIQAISLAVIELCEGESLQMNQRHKFNMSIASYSEIIQKKTAALFKAACSTTGMLLQLPHQNIHSLAEFGDTLGHIFQLRDDYLDIFDTSNSLSKKIMQDLTTGDVSLPIILAAQLQKSTTIDTIKDALNTHSSIIKTTIKTNIESKKLIAINHLSHLNSSVPTRHLQQIVDLITTLQ